MKSKRKKKLGPKSKRGAKGKWKFPNSKKAGRFADLIQTRADVSCPIGSDEVTIHDVGASDSELRGHKMEDIEKKARRMGGKRQ
jgi:hypothetical protein